MADEPDDQPDAFDVRLDVTAGAVVVCVRGEVDGRTAPALAAVISAALEQSPRGLIVDLTEVTFLTSVGVTALVVAKERTGANTGFTVVANGPGTSRAITLLGLADELNLKSTLDDAL